MDTIVADKPNLVPETVPVPEASQGLDSIASKMAAMKQQTLRNQMLATNQTETGSSAAAAADAPVVPEGIENDADSTEPEIAATDADDIEAIDDTDSPEQVSTDDSTPSDLIDFIEFAETNPNAKFKFVRNGKEIVIDAKKAASILGQGAAISEDARQLKIERAEFDEYLQEKRGQTEGLMLAMEFTIRPQLQKAYDEILKTQNYQATFRQQLASTNDPAQQARIQAAMQQNEQYIRQQSATIAHLKPNLDQFYDIRRQQVQEVLTNNRKGFQDKELRNEYVYNEIRDKVSKGWSAANNQLVPGVPNIDLISSDEHILSLIRDGLKYRDRPKAKGAGASIAALTSKRSGTQIQDNSREEVSNLREKARGGDKKAADNLLMAHMRSIRASRGR
mgnify:CR=1 FL=1